MNLPNILTVAQVLSSRRGCQGLMYRGCQLHYLDWHPAPDGTHHAVIIQNDEPEEIWLEPTTRLEEQFNVSRNSITTRNTYVHRSGSH